MPDPAIVDNATLHRFELQDDGHTAFLLYSNTGNSLRLIHTEVPNALRGRGIGSKLVEGVLRSAREKSVNIIPSCPFVIDYLKRNPEYISIVDPNYRGLVGSDE